jgi:hypothetical protein
MQLKQEWWPSLVLLALFACGSEQPVHPKLPAGTDAPQALTNADPASLSPAEKRAFSSADPRFPGCRSPDDLGCARCCDPEFPAGERVAKGVLGPTCIERSWNGGGASPVAPWFNVAHRIFGPCPQDCPRCSSCTKWDEEQLLKMPCQPECDCKTIRIGVDPCFGKGSCECYCAGMRGAARSCPGVSSCLAP